MTPADPDTPQRRSVAGDEPTEAVPTRSLTVRQPWAWAIMHGGKDVENRTWSTDLGTVAVVAGLAFDSTSPTSKPMLSAWEAAHRSPLVTGNPHLAVGAIVGVVDIVDVHLCDAARGCFREADVLGWTPVDGSDASAPGWRPRVCSPWAEVPQKPPVRGSGAMRHFVLANPRPLVHPLRFRGHQGIRSLHPSVTTVIGIRLRSQDRSGK